MKGFSSGGLAGDSAAHARRATRRRLRPGRSAAALATGLAGIALAMVFAAAASAAPPPPAPAVTPGVAGMRKLFYTAADGTVWVKNLPGGGVPTPVSDGRLVSAPAAISSDSTEMVFGQGTDNQLWYSQLTATGWTSWGVLGGKLTAKPGAVFVGPTADDYSVFVRSTDGAVWGRDHSAAGWNAWYFVSGQVLAGTGPTAAHLSSGNLYVGVVGTDHQMYLKVVHQPTGFFSIGGQTTANPGLIAIRSSQLVAFARGSNNAGYFNGYTEGVGAGGWQSMGGQLTSGLAAEQLGASLLTTYTYALGADNQVYQDPGDWDGYPPTFTGWVKVTG
jgi:hypothetical protein